MSTRIEAFIISLRDRPSRRSNVERIVAGCPVPCTVVDAVDGRTLTTAARDSVYRPGLLRPRFPFALSPAEIGTFLSHRKTWQMIVDRNLDAGLVLEDDVELVEPYFQNALQAAIQSSRSFEIIKFDFRRSGRSCPDTTAVRATVLPPLGNQAQSIRPQAARRLLELSECFDRPVDTFEQMTWVHHLRMGVVEPSGVQEISGSLGGTTIHRRGRGPIERLVRNVPRLWYRSMARARAIHHHLTGAPPGDGSP